MHNHTNTWQAIVAQPTRATQPQYGEKPNNHLLPSIINLLFCFFMLGIIALIFSLQVSTYTSLPKSLHCTCSYLHSYR